MLKKEDLCSVCTEGARLYTSSRDPSASPAEHARCKCAMPSANKCSA